MNTETAGNIIPESGQLVEVRRRQWVVKNVSCSAVREDSFTAPHHLVSLASIDEDALGEELQAIWEIEPGARVLERAGLPQISGWDAADRLEAFLDAVRWGAATQGDRNYLQAPFRSGISIEDYQLEPLVRAIDMARANLLIADDVGLGKTIEAGLVIHELLIRHRARTALIVCPASLQVKWQIEMREKFGLEFRIVDTAYLKQLSRERGIHVNPWSSFPRLITSMDWMKGDEALRLIKDILPPHVTYPRKFDILVVDEAHNVAPSGSGRYAMESQRTKLIRTIAPHFEHRLFLSATPHNGYPESFSALLELLDEQRFARSVMPDEKQRQQVIVRRLKSEILDKDGNLVYPAREILPLEIDYTTEERQAHSLLKAYTKSREAGQGDGQVYSSVFVHKLLKKRLFSSPAAFHTTLEKYIDTIKHGGKAGKAKALDERILRKAIQRTEEEYADDRGLEEAIDDVVVEATTQAAPLTAEQGELLQQLQSWAQGAAQSADSKAKAILDWLDAHLKSDGDWNDKRVILFTEYKATHTWLRTLLASREYEGERIMSIYGGMDEEDREKVKAAFQAHPDVSPVRILLATDAASEGIDLQNHCNYLIHIEIPWNPNVMEQRNGRIDRHGQRCDRVKIWHPVGKGFNDSDLDAKSNTGQLDGDLEFLFKAVRKVERIREDLGSVGPVIARQIDEGMGGQRGRLDTRNAEAKAAEVRKYVGAQKRIDQKIEKLHEKLIEARKELHLTPERVAKSVHVGLDLAGQPPLRSIDFPGASLGSVFEVPQLPGSWGQWTSELRHPHTDVRRPITFDHEVAKGRDDVVLAHLDHRLVQMCLRLLRAEVWAQEDRKRLHRISVRVVEDSDLEAPAVAIWSRLVITGGDHHRLHEELTLSGGLLKGSSFARIAQLGRLEELVEKGRPIDPSGDFFKTLQERFEANQDPILATVEARSRERLKFLENTIARRKAKDVEDIEGILSELEAAIHKELHAPEPQQLSLFDDKEKDQFKRDHQALEVRLQRIPEERKSEVAAIEYRYRDPVDRTFPVAAVFLVPRSLMGGL
jgi:superfamily II DNA or RNA helicase